MKTAVIAMLAIQLLLSFAHASEDCNHILSDRIDSAIQNLAELRKDLDLKIASGESGLIVRTLNNAFKLKQKEIIALGLTETDLEQRLKNEIQKKSSQPVESLDEVRVAQAELALEVEHRIEKAFPISVARELHTALVLNDGRIMFVGGQTLGTRLIPILKIEVFDPKTHAVEVWTEVSAPRTSGMYHLLSDGRVLIWGGRNPIDDKASTLIEVLDPISKTVRKLSFKFYQESNQSLLENTGILIQDQLLLHLEADRFFLLDLATNRRTPFQLQKSQSFAAVSQLDAESVIVSGGKYGFIYSDEVTKFHFPTNSSQLLGHLKHRIKEHRQITRSDGSVLVFGGITDNKEAVIQFFDPATRESEVTGYLSGIRTYFAVLPVSDDRALLVGGYDQNSDLVTAIELLDVRTGTSEVIGYIAPYSSVDDAFVLPDQSILITTSHKNSRSLSVQRIYIGKEYGRGNP